MVKNDKDIKELPIEYNNLISSKKYLDGLNTNHKDRFDVIISKNYSERWKPKDNEINYSLLSFFKYVSTLKSSPLLFSYDKVIEVFDIYADYRGIHYKIKLVTFEIKNYKNIITSSLSSSNISSDISLSFDNYHNCFSISTRATNVDNFYLKNRELIIGNLNSQLSLFNSKFIFDFKTTHQYNFMEKINNNIYFLLSYLELYDMDYLIYDEHELNADFKAERYHIINYHKNNIVSLETISEMLRDKNSLNRKTIFLLNINDDSSILKDIRNSKFSYDDGVNFVTFNIRNDIINFAKTNIPLNKENQDSKIVSYTVPEEIYKDILNKKGIELSKNLVQNYVDTKRTIVEKNNELTRDKILELKKRNSKTSLLNEYKETQKAIDKLNKRLLEIAIELGAN